MVKVSKLFNTVKGVSANEDGLWPTTGALGSRIHTYSTLTNYLLFNNTPQWRSLNSMQGLFDWYHSNPVFYATVMIKAREYANMEIQVWDKNKEKLVPRNTRIPIAQQLYRMFEKPNVLQSTWEWVLQRKIFLEVAGNNFTYGNFALGMKNITGLVSLWNVWPQHMKYRMATMFFEATKLEEIIESWKFEAGNYKKVWQPNEILHTNKPNTEITDDRIFGRSPAQNLVRPLTNIDMAYESRNVIMKNRGMRVILTSDRSDAAGSKIPLLDTDKEVVQEELKGYGMLEGQKQMFFSTMPLKAVPIDQDVMKLGLFEEISTDAMMVCNAYGVPEILLKLYIKGATFENQEASVRRLYQGTLIPEADEDMNSLSNFLGLDQTDYELRASYAHVPVLQESEAKKETTIKTKSDRLLAELKAKLITRDEYRQLMGYTPLPEELKDEEPEEEEQQQEDEEQEAA